MKTDINKKGPIRMHKWTDYIRQTTKKRWPDIHAFSRLALRISIQLAGCTWALGIIISYILPYTTNYFAAMAYQRAAFENAPAILLAGVIVACGADIVLRRYPPQS